MSVQGETTSRHAGPRAPRLVVGVATAVSFIAAWCIFAVEPMAARMVLPKLGGSAAVWNTALVFFQLALLAGYGLTHLTTRVLSTRAQVVVHVGLVVAGFLVLPIHIGHQWIAPTSSTPTLWLIGLFTMTVGLPYIALSAVSPLVQRWFSLSDHPRANDPYFLYAASNAGSLAGLLAYPLLLEPRLTLTSQSRVWTGAYVLFVVTLVALIALTRPGRRDARTFAPVDIEAETQPRLLDGAPVWRQRAIWVAWAFVPSSLMLGVTTHVTTDVLAIPLFFVLPLALYLVTYIVAFGKRRLPLRIIDVAFLACAAVAATTFVHTDAKVSVIIHLAVLSAAGLAFHGRLAAARPPSHRLTEFFFCTSIGGVLGGSFNALVAPVIFHSVIEYLLVLTVAAIIVARRLPTDRSSTRIWIGAGSATVVVLLADGAFRTLALVALIAVVLAVRVKPVMSAVLVAAIVIVGFAHDASRDLLEDRSFYGAFRVEVVNGAHALVHGSTYHGWEYYDAARRNEPLGYYSRTSPIGQVFSTYGTRLNRVGVIGLGAGTLAAYAEPARSMQFYEIDDKIVKLAENPKYFAYLHDAKGPVDVVVGDGRLAMARRRDRYALVVLDAFTGDSIPTHLLTEEALKTYLAHLDDNGLLAVHISNKYIDLEPVLAADARAVGLSTALLQQTHMSKADFETLHAPSKWVVLARDADALQPLLSRPGWRPARTRSGVSAWTDERSDIFSVLSF